MFLRIRQRHLASDVPVLILRIEGMFGTRAVFGRNDCAIIAFAIFSS
jgi:hypothetical protein